MAVRQSYQNGSGPATAATTVTPADGTAVDFASLYVGGAGNVTVISGGNTVTFVGVLAGTILPVQVTQVRATGTTATSIIGLA